MVPRTLSDIGADRTVGNEVPLSSLAPVRGDGVQWRPPLQLYRWENTTAKRSQQVMVPEAVPAIRAPGPDVRCLMTPDGIRGASTSDDVAPQDNSSKSAVELQRAARRRR